MTAAPVHILLTGGTGQLGRELLRTAWPSEVTVHAPDRNALDLNDRASIARAVTERPYAALINAGALTGVDQAETQVADAFAINALAPAILADVSREAGIPLIQISTDYVFDGRLDRPYLESDPVAPSNAYGASKLAGELAVLAGNTRGVVLRTAWLVSPFGRNFLKTILELSQAKDTLSIVDDQIGNPTAAADLAAVVVKVATRLIADPEAPTGLFHFANSGDASWREFAEAILAARNSTSKVLPITTTEFKTRAQRPANSRLNTAKIQAAYGVTPRPWQTFVSEIIAEIDAGEDRP